MRIGAGRTGQCLGRCSRSPAFDSLSTCRMHRTNNSTLCLPLATIYSQGQCDTSGTSRQCVTSAHKQRAEQQSQSKRNQSSPKEFSRQRRSILICDQGIRPGQKVNNLKTLGISVSRNE